MCRRSSLGLLFIIGALLRPQIAAAENVASYLERLGLRHLLIVHLEQELAEAPPAERENLINRLAALEIQLLETTSDPALRDLLEERSRTLLSQTTSDSADLLRLALLRGSFRRVERVAEQHRLRLVEEAEVAKARTELEELISQLTQLRSKLESAAETADRRLMRSSGHQSVGLASAAEEVRSHVSQAAFLLGWSLYYQSWLNSSPESAKAAMLLFAEILDTESAVPGPEDVTVDLRGLEPIARTILGMALCKSQTQQSATALAWLDLLQHPEAHEATRSETHAWRLVVFFEARQLEKAAREFDDLLARQQQAVPIAWIRLAAVQSLLADRADPAARHITQAAVGALASRGELQQILELANRFGSEALGDSGFALRYVRGADLYQQARETHKDQQPTRDAATAQKYLAALGEFEEALRQPDAASFKAAAAGAQQLIGWCRYFRAEHVKAGEAFELASRDFSGAAQAQALWMAIVSMDLAVKQKATAEAAAKLSQWSERFLAEHRGDSNAARLMIKKAAASPHPTFELIDDLLAVPPENDSHLEARRQAAYMLLQLFRTAGDAERSRAAARFLDLSRALMQDELRAIEAGDAQARERFLILARAGLEMSLDGNVDRPSTAEAILAMIDRFSAANSDVVDPIQQEMDYRRVQLHLRRDEAAAAQNVARRMWERSRSAGSVGANWAKLGAHAVFRAAHERLRASAAGSADEAAALQQLVEFGDHALESDDPNWSTPALLNTAAIVADARLALWQRHQQTQHGPPALAMFDKLVAQRPREVRFLRPAALLNEEFGSRDKALEHWRLLSAGLAPGSAEWFESRYHVIWLLSLLDPPRGREVLAQHKQLHPQLGPEPWGSRLRALEQRLTEPSSTSP